MGVAVNPITLLKRARHVYVCTSQLGFEALLVGKDVTCFGAPFYAGWGLTDDRAKVPRRGRQRSVDQLVAATLLLYPRYVHPVTGRRCEAEVVLEHLALQRQRFAEHARRFICYGFLWWKRPFARRYLSVPGSEVRFVRSAKAIESLVTHAHASQAPTKLPPGPLEPPVDSSVTVVVWASSSDREVEQAAARYRLPLWRMEDGFLRSVQLGSDLATSVWIGALAGGSYAWFFGFGTSLGRRGGGSFVVLVLDWFLGVSSSAVAVPWPRAHLRNLLGAEPILGLSQGAALAVLVGLVVVYSSLALWRTPR